MAGSGVFLIQKNREALLGTVDPARINKVVHLLLEDPVVQAVKDVKMERVGALPEAACMPSNDCWGPQA